MSADEHTEEQTNDYSILFAGQPGYLTPAQESNLQIFKDNLTKAELYSANFNDSGVPSHDDSTLL
jgi:hypothetical protein